MTLRTLRMARKLTTTQLAHRLDVNQSSVIRMEQAEARGAITLATLRRAAMALGYQLEYQFIPLASTAEQIKDEKNLDLVRGSQLDQRSIMKEEIIRDARRKSGAARMREAFELSNFGLKLRCLSKR